MFKFTEYVWSAKDAGIVVCMRPANGRRRFIVTSSLTVWSHTLNDLWRCTTSMDVVNYLFHQTLYQNDNKIKDDDIFSLTKYPRNAEQRCLSSEINLSYLPTWFSEIEWSSNQVGYLRKLYRFIYPLIYTARGVARRRQRGPGLNFKILKMWKLPRRKWPWKMFGVEMFNWASTSRHTTLRPW